MATTKIWPVRDNLSRVLEYAENHLKTANPDTYTAAELKDLREVLHYAANSEKTAKQFYVSGVNCIGDIAYQQMTATKERFGKTGGNLAYHAYQSFAPDEVTPQKCHEIGIELAKRIWGDRYEVLVTTHLNTHCVHNHFIVNSVSFVDGKKLNNNYAMYFKNLRAESDRLCREHRLSVITEPEQSKGSRYLQEAEKRGEPTMRNVVRSDIDLAVSMSMTDSQFYRRMRDWGYTFNFSENRKYPTLRAPGMKTVMRLKTLGEEYTPERITRRILDRYRPFIPPQQKRPEVRHYRYHGSFQNMRSVSGLYVMFLLFVLVLRKIRNINRVEYHPQKQRYTPEMRGAIRRIERYSEQTRLLCRHKIETPEQLTAFIESRNEQRKVLFKEQERVYNRMKSTKTPEQLESLQSERDDLSKQILAVRKELAIATAAQKSAEEIRRKLQAQREFEKQRLEAEKAKQQNKNKERGHSR
jgi:hypothetical protein